MRVQLWVYGGRLSRAGGSEVQYGLDGSITIEQFILAQVPEAVFQRSVQQVYSGVQSTLLVRFFPPIEFPPPCYREGSAPKAPRKFLG